LIANLNSVSLLGHGDRKIWLTLASIRYSSGDILGTEKILRYVRQYFPTETEALNYLAQLEFNRGNLRDALKWRKELSQMNRGNIENLKVLMSLSLQLNDVESYWKARQIYVSILGASGLPNELEWSR
jgi:tetratricopeptide (TPR) repeat protein